MFGEGGATCPLRLFPRPDAISLRAPIMLWKNRVIGWRLEGIDMRVAMVAPLIEAVPPVLYGGTERVVSVLTEELVRRGHDVTLFASGDSQTSAHLVPCAERALRLDPEAQDYVALTLIELDQVYERAAEFDIIHNHLDYFAFPFARRTTTPTVSTMHGRMNLTEVRRLNDRFPEHCRISISNDQRRALPEANWVATVYNGIDLSNYRFHPDAGDYLVFLGRISPEKRPDRAIEIARDVGMRLVIAAKVDDADVEYYEHAIAPMIANSHLVEFVGEATEEEKDELLGGAYAYLFPIDWPEPFGLTMVEAMATGTPVIAYRAGSVPEVVIDGVTGFSSDTVTGMVQAVERIHEINRYDCRADVEARFSAAAMADGYERAYAAVIENCQTSPEAGKPADLPAFVR
jgi:glycosyltransferase involved in cell wall biosynthesis